MREFKAGDAIRTVQGGLKGRVEIVSGDRATVIVRHGPTGTVTYHADALMPDYPELNSVAQGLAGVVMNAINSIVPHVTSEMPYKAQYVLEELIAELQKRV